MSDATGKRIVVTGCTRGLGRALVRYFAEAGAMVFGCGRSPKAVAELQAELPSPHYFHVVDVSDDREVESWAYKVLLAGGTAHLVINNAAVMVPNSPLWEVTDDEFAQVLNVNIRGVANVIRHFVPPMIKEERGVIANISSGWGRTASPDVAAYCASKWAIEGMTRAFAQELPEGLATVAVNPGIIDTEMLRSCFGESAGAYPDAAEWVRHAGPFFLQLGKKDNGRSLDVPGVPTE